MVSVWEVYQINDNLSHKSNISCVTLNFACMSLGELSVLPHLFSVMRYIIINAEN